MLYMNICDVVLIVFNLITLILYVQYFAILVIYRDHVAVSTSYFRIATFYSFWDMLVIVVQYVFVRLPAMGWMNEEFLAIEEVFEIDYLIM